MRVGAIVAVGCCVSEVGAAAKTAAPACAIVLAFSACFVLPPRGNSRAIGLRAVTTAVKNRRTHRIL